MIRSFVKKELGHMGLLLATLAIFSQSFFLFDLDKGPLYLSVALVFLMIVLFYVHRFFTFKDQAHLRASLADLKKASRKGQGQLKAHWTLLVIGVLSVGAGYYIALTTTSVMSALLKVLWPSP